MKQIYWLVALNRLIRSHRIKFLGVWVFHMLGLRHLFLRFDPVMACNLHCQMCYFSNKEFRKTNKGAFKKDEIERLAKMLFSRTRQIVIGCGAEPTLYKDFPDLVRLAKEYGIPHVGMVSNGQLITRDQVAELIDYGLDELMLSLHGVHKDSYERFMVSARYERFHEVLSDVDALRREKGGTTPAVRINYTVNPDNLEELADFWTVFGQYKIDSLQIRPIMDIGQEAYREFDFDRHVKRYNEIIDLLTEQCRSRGVRLLARKQDPGYTSDKEDYGSLVLDSVLRYIAPSRVWRTDFDWREEDYDAFCRRIGFSRSLLSAAFSSSKKLAKQNPFRGKLSLSYDVL